MYLSVRLIDMNLNPKPFTQIDWLGVLVLMIPLLVGCPFVGVGLSEAYKTAQIINAFVAARGTVVENSYWAGSGPDEGGAYYPVVEFKPEDGKLVRFTDGIGSLPPEYEVGAQVDVLYNPKDVHEARISSWVRLWLAPTLLTFVGTLPILIGIGVMRAVRRRFNTQALARAK
jgi:hypothetical protein